MSPLKNRVQIGSTVNKEIWEEFKQVSAKTMIPVSKLLDEAMKYIIEKYKDKF